MRIVDAHHHLWEPSAVHYDLLAPDGPLAALARPFTAATYDAVARAHGIADAVAVEAASPGADIEAETAWLLGQVGESTVTSRAVVCAAIERADVGAHLDRLLSSTDRVVGIRRSFESAAPGYASSPEIVAGVRAVVARGLVFDLVLFGDWLGDMVELVRRVPEATFVLDHLGKPKIDGAPPTVWKRQLADLARLPNVVAKVSGLVTESKRRPWDADLIRPYVDHAAACFGWDRLMFASDWPVCDLAGGYGRWLDFILTIASDLSDADRTAFLSGTAERTYRLVPARARS